MRCEDEPNMGASASGISKPSDNSTKNMKRSVGHGGSGTTGTLNQVAGFNETIEPGTIVPVLKSQTKRNETIYQFNSQIINPPKTADQKASDLFKERRLKNIQHSSVDTHFNDYIQTPIALNLKNEKGSSVRNKTDKEELPQLKGTKAPATTQGSHKNGDIFDSLGSPKHSHAFSNQRDKDMRQAYKRKAEFQTRQHEMQLCYKNSI